MLFTIRRRSQVSLFLARVGRICTLDRRATDQSSEFRTPALDRGNFLFFPFLFPHPLSLHLLLLSLPPAPLSLFSNGHKSQLEVATAVQY